VQDGLFDIGITGQDWIAETDADVEVLAALSYAKSGTGTAHVSSWRSERTRRQQRPRDPGGHAHLDGVHAPDRRYFDELGIDVKVVWSFGATEAKVPEIVDAIVDITETGSTLARTA
jgi:ATP phosphoribosyltransferase